jgi:F-type H+-transporting ATPase subunit b
MNLNATLFAQAIVFAILIAFTVKFIWPPLMAAIEERQKKMADGLAAAEKGFSELRKADSEAQRIVSEARAKAGEILERAHQQQVKIVEEAKHEAQSEKSRQVDAAKAEIDTLASRAKDQLKQQVATLAVSGAAKLLNREVDANAHRDLLNKLIAEI